MIWWVICENRLTIGFRNAFFMGNFAGNSAGNLAGNFKICKSSTGNGVANSVGNVAGKYSFLKPILNRFSHMTHQIQSLEPPLQDRNSLIMF